MKSTGNPDPDGDFASTLKDLNVRLDGLDRLEQPPPGGPPASYLNKDRVPFPLKSISDQDTSLQIQEGQQAPTMDGIRIQVSSDTPGAYSDNGWKATNTTP